MKSVAEVGDEGEDEADHSMRRPSETINYAKYLLRYVYVCVCVCCVCINLVKFGFGCAGLTASLSSRSLAACTEIGSTLTLLHAVRCFQLRLRLRLELRANPLSDAYVESV